MGCLGEVVDSPLPQNVVYRAFAYADLFGKTSHTPMGSIFRLLVAGDGTELILRFHADQRFPGFSGLFSRDSNPFELNRFIYRITDERLTDRKSDMLSRVLPSARLSITSNRMAAFEGSLLESTSSFRTAGSSPVIFGFVSVFIHKNIIQKYCYVNMFWIEH
jgi:hypothetical protein